MSQFHIVVAFSRHCENFAGLHFQLYCPVCSGCQAVALFPLSIRSKSVVSPSRRPWPDADQRARGENIRNIWTISGETRYYNIDLNLTPILEEGVYVKNIFFLYNYAHYSPFLLPVSCFLLPWSTQKNIGMVILLFFPFSYVSHLSSHWISPSLGLAVWNVPILHKYVVGIIEMVIMYNKHLAPYFQFCCEAQGKGRAKGQLR